MFLRLSFVLAALVAVVGLSAAPHAQIVVESDDGFRFQIGGTVQPRASVASEPTAAEDRQRAGFGMRRARLISTVTWRGRVGVEVELDAAAGTVEPVDVFVAAILSDRVRVRAGRMWSAQPRGFNPTSHREIDAVDRAAIIGRWARGTIGSSGRDLGVDLRYDGGPTTATLFVHDGSGIFAREEANFRESIESPSVTRATDRVTGAVSGTVSHALAAVPGLEVGAFASANGGSARSAADGMARAFATGAAHVYWGAAPGSQPLRLKADALVIAYEAVGAVEARTAAGVAGLAAVRVLGHGEVFGRLEGFWPDAGATETYATLGASYSPSAAVGGRYRTVRVTGAYSWRDVGGVPAHLAIVQGQFAF